MFAVNLASGVYLQHLIAEAGGPQLVPPRLILLINFAVIVFSMSVIVGIHRTVLLDETRHGIGFLRLDGNLLRYIRAWLMLAVLGVLFAVIFVLLLMIVAFAGGLIKQGAPNAGLIFIGSFAIAFLLGVFFLRFMLALPAAAVGSMDGLGVSWSSTRGNWMRLLAAGILTSLPFILLDAALAIPSMHDAMSTLHPGIQKPIERPVAILIASALLKAVDLAVLTVMLSLSYDVLVRGGGPAAVGTTVMQP
ncbi:MAG: hypothetical protein JWM91_1320 [Rhodospirillales bacterium]|nr:hypothetical protein [Rhodospirillales bacterium]